MEHYVMKKSGVPWVDMIPETWSVRRGKTILKLLDRPIRDDDEIITCFRDGEVTLRKNRREDGFTIALQETGYQGIEPGDLVVHGMDGFAGSIGISDSRGKATPVLNVMDSTQNKRYLMYYLRALAYKDVFMSLSTGIRVRSCDLRWNKLAVLPFLIPPIEEQNAIVSFLDDQISQIDSIIEEEKASIEDYKRWKASLISNAVTKGLNSEVPLKDSGYENLGEIPAKYSVASIRWLLNLLTDYTANGSFGDLAKNVHYKDSPDYARLVRLTDLRVTFENEGVYVDKHAYDYLAKSSLFGGEILLANVGAYAGLAVEMPKVNFLATLGPNMFLIKTDPNKWEQHFAYYSLIGSFSSEQLKQKASNTTAQPKLNKDNLKSVMVVLPPLEEQKQISSFLDSQCEIIDSLISEKISLVEDIESFKRSLIYETVTGKRKVV